MFKYFFHKLTKNVQCSYNLYKYLWFFFFNTLTTINDKKILISDFKKDLKPKLKMSS